MFTKLFSSITTSSIWNEKNTVRIVWITMLAMSDKNGYVAASVGGLAHEARVNREECEDALKVLASPDPDSRSKEFEGRRIETVDGGFQLLNHPKYRAMRSEEDRKEYMKNYMKEYRDSLKVGNNCLDVNKIVNNVNICKHLLTPVNSGKPPLAQAEADTEKKKIAAIAAKTASKTIVLMNRWVSDYEKVFPERYMVQHGKDGKAAKELLSFEPDIEKIMRVAAAAWANLEGFRCKNSVTLMGLKSNYNEIRQELNQIKGKKMNTDNPTGAFAND